MASPFVFASEARSDNSHVERSSTVNYRLIIQFSEAEYELLSLKCISSGARLHFNEIDPIERSSIWIYLQRSCMGLLRKPTWAKPKPIASRSEAIGAASQQISRDLKRFKYKID